MGLIKMGVPGFSFRVSFILFHFKAHARQVD